MLGNWRSCQRQDAERHAFGDRIVVGRVGGGGDGSSGRASGGSLIDDKAPPGVKGNLQPSRRLHPIDRSGYIR